MKLKSKQRCTSPDFKTFVWLQMRYLNRSLVFEPRFLVPSCTNPSGKNNFEIGPIVKKLEGVGRRAQVRTHKIKCARQTLPCTFSSHWGLGEGFWVENTEVGKITGIWQGWAGKEVRAGTFPWALGRERREMPSQTVQYTKLTSLFLSLVQKSWQRTGESR